MSIVNSKPIGARPSWTAGTFAGTPAAAAGAGGPVVGSGSGGAGVATGMAGGAAVGTAGANSTEDGVEVTLCSAQNGGHDPGDPDLGWATLKRFTLP